MTDFNTYLKRVPSEHRDKPRFVETLRSLLGPVLELQALMERVPFDYDLDSAVGKQLDVVGEWVGRNRYVSIPIEGVFSRSTIQRLLVSIAVFGAENMTLRAE